MKSVLSLNGGDHQTSKHHDPVRELLKLSHRINYRKLTVDDILVEYGDSDSLSRDTLNQGKQSFVLEFFFPEIVFCSWMVCFVHSYYETESGPLYNTYGDCLRQRLQLAEC